MTYSIAILYDRVFDYDGVDITIGGIQTYLVELAIALKEKGAFVFIAQRANSDFEREYQGIPIIGFSESNKRLPTWKNLAIKSHQKILSHSNKGILIWGNDQLSCKYNKLPTIAIQHGITFDIEGFESRIKTFISKTPLNFLYKFLQRYKARLSFERSLYKVCVDYNYMNWYRTYSSSRVADNIKVIPNFTKVPINTEQEKPERLSVVCARRFQKRRGVLLFANVARQLLDDGYEIDIYFAGTGPLEAELKEYMKNYANVFFTKFSAHESLSFHSDKTIAVIPSLGSEGTSLSLLEAMASGCATVSTSIGGITNIVINNFNGLLIQPNEVELKSALICLIEDEQLRKKLSLNGRLVVEEGFNRNQWAESWCELVENVYKSEFC